MISSLHFGVVTKVFEENTLHKPQKCKQSRLSDLLDWISDLRF